VRGAITSSEKPGTAPKDWFRGIDDETWLWINTTGRRRRKAVARLLPKMPNNVGRKYSIYGDYINGHQAFPQNAIVALK
jgi:hypothetical protein